MRFNPSSEWYEREFRKDAEEPVMSATAGRVSRSVSTAEETVAQTVSSEDVQAHANALSATSPQETQTQTANRLFRQQLQFVDDASVTVRAGENEQEPTYRVEVPGLRSEAFDKIVSLRSRLYRKYPDAIINIEFRGRCELDEAENNRRLADV